MTVRFQNHRIGFYIFTFALSGVVLGLAANFATIFLPDYQRDFIIFSLVVSSLNILTFMLQIQWAQPQTEVAILPIMNVLWLTEAAWVTDIIGSIQCDSLKGQTIPSKNGGHTGFQPYCYKMKTIQALSWALFCAFVIAFCVLLKLVSHARRFGRYHIWSAPINELPWFGEFPGYDTHHMGYTHPGVYPGVYPGMYPTPGVYQTPALYQPAPITVIQQGANGAPPIVTQVPAVQAA